MFQNCPPIDFSITANRSTFQAALNEISDAISAGDLYAAPVVNGKQHRGDRIEHSLDPADPSTVIGSVYFASSELAEEALTVASQSSWKFMPTEDRCQIIEQAADRLDERRFWLAAMIVREAGKPWAEADADVIEAIDFCRYYAQLMRRCATQN